jgi:hypothetical protein
MSLNKNIPDCRECHKKNNGCLAHMIDEGHKIRYSVPGEHYGRCLFRMLPKKIQ